MRSIPAWSRPRDFYPRPPRGGRPDGRHGLTSQSPFLSTPSARRATAACLTLRQKLVISIHALREEGDGDSMRVLSLFDDFYPRPPRGGRRRAASSMIWSLSFLSTPSARRATFVLCGRAFWLAYFYPRPPRGGRPYSTHALVFVHKNFYPRPPRGGRHLLRSMTRKLSKFLSTPSARRATSRSCCRSGSGWISIHALREEGDGGYFIMARLKKNFYPRPPRGGRQVTRFKPDKWQKISIHALREEGDSRGTACRRGKTYFYPRPPRGGRPMPDKATVEATIFLSTPSARRATFFSTRQTTSKGDFYPRPPRGGRP